MTRGCRARGPSRQAATQAAGPTADHRGMSVIAHAGHWSHSLLYLAPLIVLLVLIAVGARSGASGDDAA